MGPDLQKNLQDSVKSECADVTDTKCLDALDKVFGKDNDGLVIRAQNSWLSASRGAGQIGAVFAGLVAFLTAKWTEPRMPPPLNIHLPSSALSQINSASTASEVVFKTADNDLKAVSVKVTATQIASASGVSGGPLSTITAEGNGHTRGDIELDAPNNDVANAINDFFKKANCQAPLSKRGTPIDKRADTTIAVCLLSGFTNIVNAMGVGQPLYGLAETAMQVAQSFPLPTFDNQQYAAAFGQALVVGADAIPRNINGVAQDRIVPITTFLYLLATANIQHKLMEGGKIVLAQEQLLKFEQDFKPTCPAQGDAHYPKCDSFICEGKNGLCTVSPMKPCPCDGGKSNCPTDDKMVSPAFNTCSAS